MEDVKVNLDEKRIAKILKYAEMVFLTRRFVEEMIPVCHTEKDGLTFTNGLGDGNGKERKRRKNERKSRGK